MKKLVKVIMVVGLSFFVQQIVRGQSIDPLRLVEIERSTEQIEKVLKAQNLSYAPVTAGHILLHDGIEGTTNFQREFNEYLDNFHDIISILAEFYGIYYEINQTKKNVKEFTEVMAESPTNSLAVALSANRHVLYKKIFFISVDIVSDIRKVCMESSKMTEKEKMKLLCSVRPKLRAFNDLMRRLNLTIRYTTFTDVWNEIFHRALHYDKRRRADIIEQCMTTWSENAKKASKIE